MKEVLICIIILVSLASNSFAQEATFADFLLKLKRIDSTDSISFGSHILFENELDTVLFAQYIPLQEIQHSCDIYYSWQGGSYMKQKEGYIVFLERICGDHLDKFDYYVVENTVTEFVIATFDRNGNRIDAQSIGRDGHGYYWNFKCDGKHLRIFTEQGELEDPRQLCQYKDYDYIVNSEKISIGRNGLIHRKMMGRPMKRTIINKNAHCAPMTFEEFKSAFQKWDKPNRNDSLFMNLKDSVHDLQSAAFYKLVPDSIDKQKLPMDVQWIPGCYIEEPDQYLFFMKEAPYEGEEYMNYIVLCFSKKGKLESWKIQYQK